MHLLGFLALGSASLASLPAQETTAAKQERDPAGTVATEGSRSTRGAPEPVRTPTPVVNPLESYLGDWMRPRDHALLRKDTATPTAAELWRRQATVGTPSAATRKPAPKPAATTANPYIDAMNAAANPVPATSLNATPASPVAADATGPATTSVPTALTEPEAPRPAPATRYQPPPSSDAKYFPQLKRF
ncbi:MAG TPA: hypothetical protein VGD88_03385 [Opitutaceae bacterium]